METIKYCYTFSFKNKTTNNVVLITYFYFSFFKTSPGSLPKTKDIKTTVGNKDKYPEYCAQSPETTCIFCYLYFYYIITIQLLQYANKLASKMFKNRRGL